MLIPPQTLKSSVPCHVSRLQRQKKHGDPAQNIFGAWCRRVVTTGLEDLWRIPSVSRRSRIFIKNSKSKKCNKSDADGDRGELVKVNLDRKWRKLILQACGFTDKELGEHMDSDVCVFLAHMSPECIEFRGKTKLVRYLLDNLEDHCCSVPRSINSPSLRHSPQSTETGT